MIAGETTYVICLMIISNKNNNSYDVTAYLECYNYLKFDTFFSIELCDNTTVLDSVRNKEYDFTIFFFLFQSSFF